MAIPAGWVVTNLGAVADSLGETYGVSLATVGIFVTAQVATHAALQIPAGRIVDLVGGRRTALLGLSLLLLVGEVNGREGGKARVAAPQPQSVILSPESRVVEHDNGDWEAIAGDRFELADRHLVEAGWHQPQAIASYYARRGVETEESQIIVGPGSKALLYTLTLALDGDLVLPQPAWVSCAAQAALVSRVTKLAGFRARLT